MSKEIKLPAIIEKFIAATNFHNGDAFISCFAKDALVNDFSRSFWGIEAIKAWSDKEMTGDKVTYQIDEMIEHYGEFIITALTDGEYDKIKAPDPTYLDNYFTVRGDKIVKLIITKNTQKSAKHTS